MFTSYLRILLHVGGGRVWMSSNQPVKSFQSLLLVSFIQENPIETPDPIRVKFYKVVLLGIKCRGLQRV